MASLSSSYSFTNILKAYEQSINDYPGNSFDALYDVYGPKKSKHSLNDWEGSYYGEVGRALGFTEKEIRHLAHGNDSGLSFPTLAALIEEHPPVLSSAYTANRAAEEAAFCANVMAAVHHHTAQNKPSKSASQWAIGGVMLPWKCYSESLTIGFDTDDGSTNNVYEGIAKASPNKAWYSGNDYLPVAASSWKSIISKMDAITMPKHGLVLPKTGEYAKLLGIWTP